MSEQESKVLNCLQEMHVWDVWCTSALGHTEVVLSLRQSQVPLSHQFRWHLCEEMVPIPADVILPRGKRQTCWNVTGDTKRFLNDTKYSRWTAKRQIEGQLPLPGKSLVQLARTGILARMECKSLLQLKDFDWIIHVQKFCKWQIFLIFINLIYSWTGCKEYP